MRLTPIIAVLVAALPGCKYQQAEPKVTVEEAWVQLPAISGRSGAAYFTLVTNNDPTKLIRVISPRIERVELHETVTQSGIARMTRLEGPVFPSDGKLVFGPAGKHAMLFGLDRSLKPGDKVPLTFTFDPAPPITVEAEVRGMGASHGAH